MKDFDTESEMTAVQNHQMNGDRPAAFSAAKLAARLPEQEDVQELLSCALTHAVEQVRYYAAAGFDREFFKSSPTRFAHVLRCFAEASLHYAALLESDRKKEWNERAKGIELQQQALDQARKLILEQSALTDDALLKIRIDDEGADLFTPTIGNWLALLPDTAAAKGFFSANTDVLIDLWTDHEDRHNRHSNVVEAFEKTLARYLLRVDEPTARAIAEKIATVIPKESDEVGMFLWDLVLGVDQVGAIDRFWQLWPIFRDKTVSLPPHTVQRHQPRIIRKLFLDLEGASDEPFPLIQGREKELMGFYRALPVSEFSTVLFLRYLKNHGRAALPVAFVDIAQKIRDDASGKHLSANAVFLLEQVLSARIFATPLELKKDPDVRAAVISILDALVNAGSAAAFIMRDDFATPLPASN